MNKEKVVFIGILIAWFASAIPAFAADQIDLVDHKSCAEAFYDQRWKPNAVLTYRNVCNTTIYIAWIHKSDRSGGAFYLMPGEAGYPENPTLPGEEYIIAVCLEHYVPMSPDGSNKWFDSKNRYRCKYDPKF